MDKHKHIHEEVVFEGTVSLNKELKFRKEGKEWPFYYEEGAFVPVPHNLVVVGAVTFYGYYWVIGKRCFYFIEMMGDTEADTTASTAGVTYFDGLPRSVVRPGSSCLAADYMTYFSLGGGFNSTSDEIYPPTWPASTWIIVEGSYSIA